MVRRMSARVQRIWYARIVKCALCFTGVLMAAVSYATESPYASGGNVTTFLSADGLYNIYVHTFTNASAVEMFRNLGKRTLSLRYLVVGGGGAGAKGRGQNSGGGGGGGGGVYENDGYELAEGASLSVSVGQGAPAVTNAIGDAKAAGASSLTDGELLTVSVLGGGNGAYAGSGSSNFGRGATQGAAGGGGARYAVPQGGETEGLGATGTYLSSQFGISPAGASSDGGFSGAENNTSKRCGGGGGGASAAGSNTTGGVGLASDITGESLVYGSGGGGGGMFYTTATYIKPGGEGGKRAGDGGTYEVKEQDGLVQTNLCRATPPAPNSGCGGGGGLAWQGATDAQKVEATGGADGIVVIRYQVPVAPCVGGDIIIKRHVRGTRYSYVHIFTNTAAAATFENQAGRSLSLRYLVVGGGGAGSAGSGSGAGGAGGGGGGVVEARGLQLDSDATLSVEVGAGAAAVSSDNRSPVAGTSRIRRAETVVAEAPGGGNAGVYFSSADYLGATSGANGGGAARGASGTTPSGETGTFKSSINGVEYGYFKGGDYNNRVGGSGAGAGSDGGKATGTPASGTAAVGGEGLASDITGESLVYGSGGGAGEAYLTTYPGFQGSDGGTRAGNGTKHDFSVVDEGGVVTTNFNYIAATAPAANSGGGGGGGGIASKDSSYRQGTGGADGIVVIRYEFDSVVHGFVISFR